MMFFYPTQGSQGKKIFECLLYTTTKMAKNDTEI